MKVLNLIVGTYPSSTNSLHQMFGISDLFSQAATLDTTLHASKTQMPSQSFVQLVQILSTFIKECFQHPMVGAFMSILNLKRSLTFEVSQKASRVMDRSASGSSTRSGLPEQARRPKFWEFPRIRGALFLGVLIIRILLFRVLYWGPLFSETPKF